MKDGYKKMRETKRKIEEGNNLRKLTETIKTPAKYQNGCVYLKRNWTGLLVAKYENEIRDLSVNYSKQNNQSLNGFYWHHNTKIIIVIA